MSGASKLHAITAVAKEIESGGWGAYSLGAASAGRGQNADPTMLLSANGLGWAVALLEPLRGWQARLVNDAGQVDRASFAWIRASEQLQIAEFAYESSLMELNLQSGATVSAYLGHATEMSAHVRAAASSARAIARGLQLASDLVRNAQAIVHDALSQLVSVIVSAFARVSSSPGFDVLAAAAQIGARVRSVAAPTAESLRKALHALAQLEGLFGKLGASIAINGRSLATKPGGVATGLQTAFVGASSVDRNPNDGKYWDYEKAARLAYRKMVSWTGSEDSRTIFAVATKNHGRFNDLLANLIDLRSGNWWSLPALVFNTSGFEGGESVAAAYMLYDNFKTNAKWDLKPYLAKEMHPSDSDKDFKLRDAQGRVTRSDSFGNVLYGGMLANYGVSLELALKAANLGGDAGVGNDPVDDAAVELGFRLVKKYPRGITEEQFLEEVARAGLDG